MQILESEPNLGADDGADGIEVIFYSKGYESDVYDPKLGDDYGLPIAIRKGVRKCTQHPLYPLSHFVSYEKLSGSHKSFLTHLNTITIPKTIFEALGHKEWKEAISVEMEALENIKHGNWLSYLRKKNRWDADGSLP